MGKFDTPVNITAARVISKGTHYEANLKGGRNLDAPMETLREIPKQLTNQSCFQDFTGVKLDRLTVIGLARRDGTWKTEIGKWVVRCNCGQYEVRSAKAIKGLLKLGNDYGDQMCLACIDLKKIRILDKARQKGLTYKEYCEIYDPRKNWK